LVATVLTPSGTQAEPSAPCPYPVSGYWLFGRSRVEDWREVLARIHRLGADTVIQFGHRPARATIEAVRAHPVFSQCRIDGQELVASAQSELAAANPGNRLRHVYTFEPEEDFGPALIVRPQFDKRVEVGDHLVWRLVVPAADPGDRSVDFTQPQQYDLILVSGRRADSVAMLLDEAEALGMGVFVGMPCAPAHPQYPWDPWGEASPAFLELTKRVLEDYAARYGAKTSFAGIYQSLETPVSAQCLGNVLVLYSAQHALVRSILPGKRILLSPYWDARKGKPTGTDVAAVKQGIKLLARRDVDIIAPQDSRGTGKVGLFRPHQASDQVDPRLTPSVGAATYGEAYYATTTDFYRAAREALDELAEQENLRVELWANLEAFEPGAGVPCGSFSTTQRTTKERLDQAIMFAGPHPSKLISYMWDSYYTCKAGLDESLGDEIEADWRRPIVVEAFPQTVKGQGGVILRGYNLTEAGVELAFADRAGADRRAMVPAAQCKVNAAFGGVDARYPVRLQEVWVPFYWSAVAADSWLKLAVTGAGGTCHHAFSLRR
jgi:hypothetical protein